MAGTSYSIEVDFSVTGDPGGKIGSVGDKVEGLSSRVGRAKDAFLDLGSTIVGSFTGAVETVGSLGMTMAKIGGAAAFGGLVYGVTSLNAGLEQTQMSLGSILQAAGQVPSIERGLLYAGGIMTSMRKDAAALPGEFSDLIGIFRTIATSGFNSGMGVDALEKFSARAMAAGAVMGLNSAMVGRELSMALEGRVGGHNIFATRLGIVGAEAEKFRKLDAGKRVEYLTEKLGKYDGAIKAFGNSFEAQSSALVDNFKTMGVGITQPVFKKVVETLGEVNDWFDKNQGKVKDYADRIGYQLVKAFDAGKAAFIEYAPLLLDFGERAYDKIVRLWQDAEPYVKSIGAEIKDFLKDDSSLDKIGTILKLYIAAKGGSALIGVGQTIGSVAGPLAGLFSGGGAAGAAGAAGAGAAGAGASVGAAASGADAIAAAAIESGTFAGYGVVGSISAAGAALTATITGVFAAIAAAIGASAYEIYDANKKAQTVDAMGGGAYGYSDREMGQRGDLIATAIGQAGKVSDYQADQLAMFREAQRADNPDMSANAQATAAEILAGQHERLAEQEKRFVSDLQDVPVDQVGAGFSDVGDAAVSLAATLRSLAKSGDFAAIAKINAESDAAAAAKKRTAETNQQAGAYFQTNAAAIAILAANNIDKGNAEKKAAEKAAKEAAAKGKGGTHIAQVLITVSSNQAPGQIARDVASELIHMKRFRTNSPRTTNFGAGR